MPDPVNVEELRNQLAEHHADHPQRAMLADAALREVQAALDKLASLGHRLLLVRDASPPPERFPMMVYKTGQQGQQQQLTVGNEGDLETAKGDGWSESQQQPGPSAEAGGAQVEPEPVHNEPAAEPTDGHFEETL